AGRRLDRQPHRVGDRVADRDRLHPKRPELHRVADAHFAQVRLAQDAVLPELWFDEPERQACAVYRHVVEALQGERQAADVVLMAVGQHDADDLSISCLPATTGRGPQEVRDVRQDEVDAEHVLLREHEPGVHDQDLVLPLEAPHVDPDLAEAAQREVTEARGRYRRRSCSDSGTGAATGTGGGGGASIWSRYRFSWSKSCSRSATSAPLCSAAAGW